MAARSNHVQSIRMSVFRGDSNEGEMVTYDVPVREAMVRARARARARLSFSATC